MYLPSRATRTDYLNRNEFHEHVIALRWFQIDKSDLKRMPKPHEVDWRTYFVERVGDFWLQSPEEFAREGSVKRVIQKHPKASKSNVDRD